MANQSHEAKKARMDKTYVKEACKSFLNILIERKLVTHPDVFYILSQAAMERGYTLLAEQRSGQGTYIHFIKEPLKKESETSDE